VAQAIGTYEPRDPAQSVLYHVVRDHFETFRAQAASLRDGEGLPRFVEREFREFLTCGCLAAGFARFHCDACGHDRLVPFSCKGRGFCPSCGGRRMAERAAHLIDHVLPDVPVRQWVLSLPYRLRYLLAWDHDLCRAVVGVSVRAIFGFLRARARRDGVVRARSGAVAIIHASGRALRQMRGQTRRRRLPAWRRRQCRGWSRLGREPAHACHAFGDPPEDVAPVTLSVTRMWADSISTRG
jgi:hypothetical protein